MPLDAIGICSVKMALESAGATPAEANNALAEEFTIVVEPASKKTRNSTLDVLKWSTRRVLLELLLLGQIIEHISDAASVGVEQAAKLHLDSRDMDWASVNAVIRSKGVELSKQLAHAVLAPLTFSFGVSPLPRLPQAVALIEDRMVALLQNAQGTFDEKKLGSVMEMLNTMRSYVDFSVTELDKMKDSGSVWPDKTGVAIEQQYQRRFLTLLAQACIDSHGASYAQEEWISRAFCIEHAPLLTSFAGIFGLSPCQARVQEFKLMCC